MKQEDLIPIIEGIVNKKKETTAPPIRSTMDELNKRGIIVSTSQVWEAYRRLGLVARGHRFVFRHNPTKGE